jgi:hypothetical protein
MAPTLFAAPDILAVTFVGGAKCVEIRTDEAAARFRTAVSTHRWRTIGRSPCLSSESVERDASTGSAVEETLQMKAGEFVAFATADEPSEGGD